MKKLITLVLFFMVWLTVADSLVQISWWKPYLHPVFISIMALNMGLSVGATCSILFLSLLNGDPVIDISGFYDSESIDPYNSLLNSPQS